MKSPDNETTTENKETSKESGDDSKEFELILRAINPQGKFQQRFLYIFLGTITIMGSMQSAGVFMYYIPDHWCHDPNWETYNFSSYEQWKNATIPREKKGANGKEEFSQCEMCIDGEKTKCQYGWNYDKSDLSLTIPSEFNWVCDRSSYFTIALTVSVVARILGTILLGPVVDMFGRRRAYIYFSVVDNLAGISMLFLPKYFEIYLAVLFFTGIIMENPFIILSEISDSEFRSKTSATLFCCFVIGMSTVPLIVWLLGNWFYIGLAVNIPRVLVLFGFFLFYYIPESPRWLNTVGRQEEAKEVITKIATVNGTLDKLKELDLDALLQSAAEKKSTESKYSAFTAIFKIMSRPRLARNTILLSIATAVGGFIYGGMTLNSPYMPGNKFVTYFILAIIELPSSLLGGFLLQTVGRRWTQFVFFIITAVCSFVAAWTLDSNLMSLINIIIAKFTVNICIMVSEIQSVEIFPTPYRATGAAFTDLLAQFFGLAMPTIINMGRSNPIIPYIAFGVAGVAGTLSSFFLPETLHQYLPETLADANDFGKDHKLCGFLPRPIESKVNDIESIKMSEKSINSTSEIFPAKDKTNLHNSYLKRRLSLVVDAKRKPSEYRRTSYPSITYIAQQPHL